MKRNSKNKNCRYALVKGIVFSSYSDAERYCATRGLDADLEIQSDDPAVLAECKRIAYTVLPTLRLMQGDFDNKWAQMHEYARKQYAEFDAAKARNDLCLECYGNRAHEAGWEASGFHEGMKLLYSYIETLENIIRL